MKNRKNKLCIISLTYNRPKYIVRSFESLYKRAGCKFDHYVFDDRSDEETQEALKTLQKRYGFNLYMNPTRMNIYRSFHFNLKYVPLEYDYYVKFDSDIEILSDNFFPQIISSFKFPKSITGVTPRLEGVRNVDRYDTTIDFYGGHAIKNEAPIVYGCCLVIPNNVFVSFKRLTDDQLKISEIKWGVDSALYDHAKKMGNFLIVEDLSIYHIDNTYGQRRVNNNYFTDRKRWSIIDNDEVWFMNASKLIYPRFLDRSEYDVIKRSSSNFENFLTNCDEFIRLKKTNSNVMINNKIEFIKPEPIIIKTEYMKKMYKVTSPMNFRTDPNLTHGESKYFAEIPTWAKNNPRLVIEDVEIPVIEEKIIEKQTKDKLEKPSEVKIEKSKESEEKKIEIEKEVVEKKEDTTTKSAKKDKKDLKCDECGYATNSLKRLKTHRKKHK